MHDNESAQEQFFQALLEGKVTFVPKMRGGRLVNYTIEVEET